MEILISILAIVFVLGITINIHEFGHFITAKLFGMRVDAYSFFGLGPRIWGFKVGETDYRISAIPFGAFVLIHGDETNTELEGEEDHALHAAPVPPEQLYELRPAWQKFVVLIGGPAMNILLALAIPFGMALYSGVPANPSPIVGSIKAQGAGEKAGLKAGDRIVSFEGRENPTWDRIEKDAMLQPEKPIQMIVERGGTRIPLTITPTKTETENGTLGLLDIDYERGVEPVVVRMVQDGMPAAESGIQAGDLIVSLNGNPVKNVEGVRNSIKENGDNPIKLTVNRNGQPVEITTKAKLNESGTPMIGVQFDNKQTLIREPVGVAGAAAYAWNTNIEVLRLTGKAFGQVGTGERSATETFSGPVGIAKIISQVALSFGWEGLLNIMALISLNLGVFNLLPIPVLDGGRILLLGVEKVLSWFGKTLSLTTKNVVNYVGLAAVLLLMVFSTFNDIAKFFK